MISINSINYIFDFFRNNSGALILLIALTVIISIEVMVYIQSLRYILVGLLLSGLVFLGLGMLFYGYSTPYLYSILTLIVIFVLIFIGTYIISFIIFLLYLFDVLLVLIIYFSFSIYSIWTWVISLAISIVMFFLVRHLEKTIKEKLFLLDSEINKRAREKVE